MKTFYKIENGNLLTGAGTIIPDGFVEFVEGNENTELSDALALQKINDMKSYISVYRRQKENGGITVSGVSVKTDTETRASLLGAVQLKTAIDWKTDNGFVTLTPAQISGIATAVGQHIQKCFSAEKAVTELHAETPYTTLDAIETAFDGAYNV